MTTHRTRTTRILTTPVLFVALLTVLINSAATATAQNPVPFIDQPLVPDAAAPGGAGFTLTLKGAGFVATSVVNWNASPRATTYVSNHQLTATILASDIITASTAAVTVVSPSPGGGVSNTQFFSIVVSSGSVSFLPAVTYGSGDSEYASNASVAVAALKGDGELDLIVANEYSGSNGYGSVGVLLGNGDGTFQPAVNYGSGGYAVSVVVADVNGDGKLDVVVGNSGCPGIGGGCVGVLVGNGDGTFKPAVVYGSGGGSGDPFGMLLPIAVVDVNSDGRPDVLVANPCTPDNASCSGGSVGVLLGNGDGTFQPAVSYGSGGYLAGGLAVADLNGDGKPDLVVTNCEATGSDNCISSGAGNGVVGVLLGNGDGTFQAVKTYSSGTPEWVTTPVVVADVNGDGKLDLLIANEGGDDGNGEGSAGVLLGNGDGTFQPVVLYASGGDWATSIAVADLNGDGKPDLALANFSGSMGVLLGNGDGTFQPAQSYPAGTVNHSISVLVTDVNGDGIQGALVMTWGPVEVLLGNGDGTFQPAQSYPSGAGPFVGNGGPVLAIGDLSSNGETDLVVANNGEVGVLLNNTQPGSRTTTTLSSSPNPSIYGQAVTFRASVSSSAGTPTGVVVFYDGPSSIGSATLASGSAEISVSSLAGGVNSVTAAYQGSISFSASTSAPVSQLVQGISTVVTLVSSPNPSIYGQSITFTATVTSTGGIPPNGETVTFYNGLNVLGTGSLTAGVASLIYSKLVAGISTVTAAYLGDANFTGSTSPALLQVVDDAGQSTTTTTLASSLNPSIYGQKVTLTATVTTSGKTTPTGRVNFKWNSYSLGEVTLNSSGVATFTKSNLNADTYPLLAEYLGDTNNGPSASPIVNQVVTQATSTATLTSSPNPSTQGQSVTFTAKITSPTTTPTGPVTFTAGKTTLATVELTNGKATLTTSTLAVGSTTVTVTYPWNSDIAGSSASVVQVVDQ
jgi:hypothetical protein